MAEGLSSTVLNTAQGKGHIVPFTVRVHSGLETHRRPGQLGNGLGV